MFGPSYYPADKPELTVSPNKDQTIKVRVSKDTHRVEFENETEDQVTIVITPKETKHD